MPDQIQIGYDPDFIGEGITIPFPTFSRALAQSVLRKPEVLRDEIYSDHVHFTVVMNEHSQQLIYSAYNIDQNLFKDEVPGEGKRSWRKDKDIGNDFQLGNEFYKDRKRENGDTIPNPYDRGHMVMRFNNMWGRTKDEADKAGKSTFVYANSSFQHENLNRDEWKELELEIVRPFNDSTNGKLAVFTGPIFGDLDRHVNLSDQKSARVPSGFFKVICYRSKSDEAGKRLGVLAFAIFQDDQVLRDKKGNASVKTDRRYQVTISELQDLTGIKFGKKLYNANPLFYHDNKVRAREHNVSGHPERIPVGSGLMLIHDADEIRRDQEDLANRRIIINSAMINPKAPEAKGEWVSLHNRGVRKTSINKWKLIDGHGREALLNGGIASGESIRLRGKDIGKVKLSNSGGSLMLFDSHGCLIDHVTWSKKQVDRTEEEVAFLFDRAN